MGLYWLVGQELFKGLIYILTNIHITINTLLLVKINLNSKQQLFKFLGFLIIMKRLSKKNQKSSIKKFISELNSGLYGITGSLCVNTKIIFYFLLFWCYLRLSSVLFISVWFGIFFLSLIQLIKVYKLTSLWKLKIISDIKKNSKKIFHLLKIFRLICF